MQGPMIVGGWAIDGAIVLNPVLDRIANNDASMVYIRLSSPSIQQQIKDNNLTKREIAKLCFQSLETLQNSLDRLLLLGLINVELVAVPRRTHPATQITINAPTLTLPAPVQFPDAPPVAPSDALQAVTNDKGKGKFVYRPEWGPNAPYAVLKLIDDLQGGRPEKILESHYKQNLKKAQELAVYYTPDDLRERWAKLYPKPKGWVSANYFYTIMPEIQKGAASNGNTTKPASPDPTDDRTDIIRAAYRRRQAQATRTG